MKAKDLTQADVGKWVTLRAQIISMADGGPYARLEGDTNEYMRHEVTFPANAILSFSNPPPTPVQEVGDVFYNGNGDMWTLRAIVGDACLLTGPDHDGHTDGIRGERYPLPRTFTLLHKGQ